MINDEDKELMYGMTITDNLQLSILRHFNI
jgi:hypothetical protein